MNLVKIKKISESAAPDCRAGKWESYKVGQNNGESVSLPVDYEVKGKLAFAAEVGNIIYLNRTERNGVAATGIFASSKIISIKKIDGGGRMIETRNSVYLLEDIEE